MLTNKHLLVNTLSRQTAIGILAILRKRGYHTHVETLLRQ